MSVKVNALDHLVINVADVERSAKWYATILGMEIRVFDPGPGKTRRTSLVFGNQKINVRPRDADKVECLALELEVQAAVVDRPRAVGLDQQPAVGVARSAPRACRRSPGSRLTLVIRTIGWRAKPSARMQPPERSRPISAAVSRELTGSPRARPRGRSARCGPPRPRRPSGSCRARRGVASAVTLTCSEPKRSEPIAVRSHEAGAGVGGLAAEHAVELDGVADRLVQLRAELLAGEDQRGARARARGRASAAPRPRRTRAAPRRARSSARKRS